MNKEIKYDRETRDYAMRLDGELVGFARTYHEAEVTLNQTVFELLSAGHFATATELDGDDCPDHGPHADDDCPKCEVPIFDDVARVLDMALGQSHGAASVVAELRRIRARLAAEQDTDTKQNQPTGWCYVCGSAAWAWDASGPLCPSHQAVVEDWASTSV